MGLIENFSSDYFTARKRFVTAAGAAAGAPETFTHPQISDPRGPVAIDVARFGPRSASHVLFVVSGVHGTEGVTGSAVQLELIDRINAAPLEDDFAVVMIHALNPVGCAYVNRTNENNIDLNRNFMNFAEPLPVNEAYDEMHEILCPGQWDEDTRQATNRKIDAYIEEYGLSALTQQVLKGQYSHADGLFYGGVGRSWSTQIASEIFANHCDRATRAAILDVHTGLGPKGFGETFDLTGSPEGATLMGQMTGQMCHVLDEIPHLELRLKHLIEIGTVGFMEILNVHRANTWATLHGGPNHPLYEDIKRQTFNALCIDEDNWKQQAMEQSLAAFKRLKTLLLAPNQAQEL